MSEEVDDVDTNLNSIATPAIGLSSYVGERIAPMWTAPGAALAFAGSKAAHGVRTTDLPVPVPRGAPV